MAVESIGIQVDLSRGVFVNTVYKNGNIELAVKGKTYNGLRDIYYKSGYWESEVIDTVNNYLSLNNLAISSVINTNVRFQAYTRTSSNQITWTPFVPISSTGRITSPKDRFVQIKIELNAGLTTYTDVFENFDNTSATKYNNTNYIEFNGALSLKREYDVSSNTTNISDGRIYVTRIDKSNYKTVDKIGVNLI